MTKPWTAIDPGVIPPAAHIQRGRAHEAAGRDLDALREYQAAYRGAPGYEAAMTLGRLLVRVRKPEEAIGYYSRALVFRPGAFAAHLAAARAHIDLLHESDALRSLAKAEEIDPASPDVPLTRAHLHQVAGRFAEAEAEFERALAQAPTLGAAYLGLVTARRVTPVDEPLLERLLAAQKAPNLDPADAAAFGFSLGKAYDDLGRYEEAMAAYDGANRIAREASLRGRTFDRPALVARVDKLIRTYDSEFFARIEAGSPSERPIFIVGMLRSGTTLVEQILSGHPDVRAAGELSYWAHADARPNLELPSASADYLSLTEPYVREGTDPANARVTDKYPANFLSLGRIHAAFPNARIVHMRRNPADTALSIYMTPLRTPPDYGCDKANIAFFYMEYRRLMAHWRAVLPGARLIEIDYEDLVADGEPVIRRLLEFCGLPWNETCLRPEANSRPVRTPSLWQVRQPIYPSSVRRWENYRPWLGEIERLHQCSEV